jgi:hypothetical protein
VAILVFKFIESAVFRMDQTKASMSSKMKECTHRCMLLCRVLSNKYSGSDLRVANSEDHDCGRKICTCNKLVAIRLFTSGLFMSFPVPLKAVMTMLIIT